MAIAVIGLILSLGTRYTQKEFKKYLVSIFSMLTAYTVSNLILWNVTNVKGYGYMIVSYICLFCESLFSSMILPVLNKYLLYCVGKNMRKNPLVYITDSLWLVYFILLVIAQFTKWIYYYTPNNEYFRGPFYSLLLIPLVLLMAVNLFALFKEALIKSSASLNQRKSCYLFHLSRFMLIQKKNENKNRAVAQA